MKKRIIKSHHGICLLLLFMGLVLSGCAHKQRTVDDSFAFANYDDEIPARVDREKLTPSERFAYDYRSPAVARMRDESFPVPSDNLIARAKTALGTPYVRGGTSRAGFDCSGFVQWAYRHVGVQLPRTAQEQSVLGTAIDFDDMEAGDIVAFRHPRRGYHTGIYIGDGKFIHSPRRGKRVEITSLDDPYFSSTFLGARRVGLSESESRTAENLVAMYERRKQQTDASASFSSSSNKGKEQSYTASSKKKGQTASARVTEKKKTENKKAAASSSKKHDRQVSQKKSDSKMTASSQKSRSGSKAPARSAKKK